MDRFIAFQVGLQGLDKEAGVGSATAGTAGAALGAGAGMGLGTHVGGAAGEKLGLLIEAVIAKLQGKEGWEKMLDRANAGYRGKEIGETAGFFTGAGLGGLVGARTGSRLYNKGMAGALRDKE